MAPNVIFLEGVIELLLDNVFIKLNVTTSLHQNWKDSINMGIHSTGSHIESRVYLKYIRNNLNMDFQGLSDHAESRQHSNLCSITDMSNIST